LRQFGCLTGAKKVCWPPFTILWLLEPTLKGDLIVLGFYGVVNYRLELHRIVRVVLVANKSDYINAMKREFNFTQQDAEKKAKNSKGWSFKHTIIQDAGDLSNNRKKLFNICHELVHQFQDQESNRRHNKIRWISEGAADVITARILESINVERLAQYRQWWEQAIRKANQVPKLTELHDMKDWMAAIDKYGTNITYRTADLAVLDLVSHNGFESLFVYFKNMKNGNVDNSFKNAFGISLANYERR
jgi:hypothetical protein